MQRGGGTEKATADGTTPLLQSFAPHEEVFVSYSQAAEDVRLWRVFREVEHGFYVDVGAADPTAGSVTRAFYDRGWCGINIEPGPLLARLVAERPRDVNLGVAVGEVAASVSFFVAYPDLGMSTLDPSVHGHVPGAVDHFEEKTVQQLRLDAILEEHAADQTIHFLKIDVEGAEREVLASADWRTWRPVVIVVEAVASWSTAPTHRAWEGVLEDSDYAFAAFDGINRYYVDRAHAELIPILEYPVSPLDRFVPSRMRDLEVSERKLQAELEAQVREERRVSEHYRAELAATYRSRTWRAGRVVAALASPARAMNLLRHPVGAGSSAGTPAEIYEEGTRAGAPWYFPRDRTRSDRARRGSPLNRVIEAFGSFAVALDANRAGEIVEEVSKVGWADEDSLLTKQLSYEERQALIEAESVARLTLDGAVIRRAGRVQSTESGRPVVVVDARCLQDTIYRDRGVGTHGRTVLSAARAAAPREALVLLTSAHLPELDAGVLAAADEVVSTPYALRDRNLRLFVELSPMTASAAAALPFLARDGCLTASVVHDFIPTEFASAYLTDATARLTNSSRIQALRHYDLLLANSRTTESECRRILGDSTATVVTGVADGLPMGDAEPAQPQRFILVPSGGDPRKNLLAALAAVALAHRSDSSPSRAVVTGFLTASQQVALAEFARSLGSADALVEVRGHVGEAELASLYETAELVLVPSFAEGYSIPIAQALRRGTPVVASDIPAHRELVGSGYWLVDPSDVEALAHAMGAVQRDREGVAANQTEAMGDSSDPERVFYRLTQALRELLADRQAASSKGVTPKSRPRLAVVSPFPPQRSGVADYTSYTFSHVARHADVDVYSSTQHGRRADGLSMHPISTRPYLEGRYDAVVNVLGNSHFNLPMLDLLGSYGGASVAHDNRMFEAYRLDRGDAWTAALVSTDSRRVRADEIDRLLLDLDALPSLGYGLIARQSTPLIVHGRALAQRIEGETGVAPLVIPFVPYNVPHTEELGVDERERARIALGLSTDVAHVATFGIVDRRTKGADRIVGALAWLSSWGVPSQLHVVGECSRQERRLLAHLATDLGVSSQVTFHGHVTPAVLRQFHAAVDAAVQLRTSSLLSLSGALADCIAYGIPTLTTSDLAEEMEAPSYVMTTGPATSSLLVAEGLAALLQLRRTSAAEIEADRRQYLRRRSPDAYASALLSALGLGAD